MPSERSVESWVVQYTADRGGKALKLTGYVGIPDRLVLLPGGVVFFVETKTIGGRLSKAQRLRHHFLRALGFKVYVPWTKEQVEKTYERYRT